MDEENALTGDLDLLNGTIPQPGTETQNQTPFPGDEGKKVGAIFDLLISAEARSTPEPQVIATPDEFGRSQYDRNITVKEDLYNLENFRGQQQSGLDKFGNFLVRFPVSVGTNVVGGLGGVAYGGLKTVYKGIEALTDDKDQSAAEIIRNLYDNELFDGLDHINETLGENLPFYYTDLEKRKGLLSQAGTANFWFDKFANGMSFITGAVLTEMAATAIGGFLGSVVPWAGTVTIAGAAASGNAMRLNKLASKIFKGVNREKKLENVMDLADAAGDAGRKMDAFKVTRQLLTGAMYESSIEAGATYHTTLETLMDREYGSRFAQKEQEIGRPLTEDEKIELLTPEERFEVDRQASTIANFNFAGNFILVGAGNMITLPRVYGVGVLDRMNNLSSKGLLGKAFKKTGAPSQDLIDKGLLKIGLGAKTRGVGNWVARSVYEGVIEEGLQGVMAKASEDYALRASLGSEDSFDMMLDWLNSFAQGAEDTYTTTEGLTEVFIGSLAAAIGVPYSGGRGFRSGLGWTADVQDAVEKDKTFQAYNTFQAKFKKDIEELEKKYPDLQGKLKSGLFMLSQFAKNKEALEQAIKEGDTKKAKDLDFDDVFEYMLHKVDTASAEEIEYEIADILSMNNETFKKMFQYSEDMTEEDVLKRKGYLAEKIRSDFKLVKEASEKMDRAIRIKDVDKFRMESGSLGLQRRILIHAATSIKNRDAREKELLSKLAELTGGKITSVEGQVDRIEYTDAKGKTRTLALGKMNTGTTVGEQIVETRSRITDLESIDPKERTAEQVEELTDLTGFLEDLEALPDITAPVIPLFKEAKNSLDKDTIDAWGKEDVVSAAQNRKEVEQLFNDIRKLRADRIRFANVLKTYLDPQLAKADAARVKKESAEINKIVTKQLDESEVRKRDFEVQLKNYKDRLEARMTEIGSTLKTKQDELTEIAEDILELKKGIEKFEKDPSKKRAKVGTKKSGYKLLTREQVEKELEDSKLVRRELENELKEFMEIASKEVSHIQEISPILDMAIEEQIDPNDLPSELQKIHQALIRLSKGSGPEVKNAVIRLQEENAKTKQLLEDFKNETLEGIAALENLENTIKAFIDQFPDVNVFDSEGKWKDTVAGNLSGQDPVQALKEVEKIILAQKQKLKTTEARIKRNQERLADIQRAYLQLRLFQEMPEILKEATKRVKKHDMDGIEDGNLRTEDLPDNYFLPDISYPGFWKTSGKNFSGKEDPMGGAANTVERLSKKDPAELTDEEILDLKLAQSQVRWFEYLSKNNKNVLASYTEKPGDHVMIFVTEEHLKKNPELEEIREDLEGTFRTVDGYSDIKAVMAYVTVIRDKNKREIGRKLEFITDSEGKAIFTSLPTPELQINGRDRFTNKFGENAPAIEKKWDGTRKKIENSPEVIFSARINGKSPGTINLQRGEKNYAIDAVMGANLQNVAIRVATIANTENDPTLYKNAEISFGENMPAVTAKPGTVWAYDHVRHLPIPMRRSLLDENAAEQVVRMFERYFKEFENAKKEGMSDLQAKKIAKETEIRGKGKDGKEVMAGKLWDTIESIVYMNAKAGPYMLTEMFVKKETAILFGDMDEYVTAKTLADPTVREEFKQFLMTKRHQVTKTKAENSTKIPKGSRTFKNAATEKFYMPVFAQGGEVESLTEHNNYSEYLLKKNSLGFAPLHTEAINIKDATYLNPRAEGGYLILDSKKGLMDTVQIEFVGKSKQKQNNKGSKTEANTNATNVNTSYTGAPSPDINDIFGGHTDNKNVVEDVPKDVFTKTEEGPSREPEQGEEGPREGGPRTEPPPGFSEGMEILDVDDLKQEGELEEGDPEDLKDAPFPLLDSYANAVNRLLEKYNALESKDEVERVLQMRPLEIVESEVLLNSIDGKAQAQLVEHGKVLLSKFASPGALFHEAFHDVSLYILSPKDSQVLYSKIRQIPGEAVTYKGERKKMSDLTDKEAEEWAAEEFRKYVLLGEDFKFGEGTVEDTRTALQKFFDSIKNLLRRLLGLNSAFEYDPSVKSIEGLFSDIAGGKFLKAKRNSLRVDAGPYDMLAEIPGYNAVYSRDFMGTLSAYLGPKLHGDFVYNNRLYRLNRGMFVSKKLAQDRMNKRLLYAAYLSAMEDMRTDLKNSISEIEGKEKASDEELLEVEAMKTTLNLIGEREGANTSMQDSLVVEHYKYLQQIGMDIEKIEETDEEDRITRNMMSDHSSLEMSPSQTASGTTKLFLGTLKDTRSKNSTGLSGTYDMSTVLKTLQNELAGKMTFTDQMIRMRELEEDPRYPWMSDVIRIFDFNIIPEMSPSQVAIRVRFTTEMANTIAYPSIVKVEESGRIYELDPVSSKRELNIKARWSANMKQMANRKATYVSVKRGKMVVDPKAKFNLPTLEGNPRYTTLTDLRNLIKSSRTAEQLLHLYTALGVEFSNVPSVVSLIDSGMVERFQFSSLKEDALMIIDDLIGRKEPFANLFDRKFTQSVTRANRLAELEALTGEMSIEGAYLNGAGKMEHNKMKNHAVSAIANMPIEQLEEYYNPVSYPFGTGSLFLQERRNGEKLEIVNIAGLSPDIPGETGEKVGKLTENDIATMHVYHAMNNISIIPRAGDKGTEFGIRVREDFKFPTNTESALEVYIGYLKSELASSAMGIVEGQHLKRFDRNIKELRIFKSIVNRSKGPIDKFLSNTSRMKQVRKEWRENNGESDILDAFIELHIDEISDDIRDQIRADRDDLIAYFENSELISEADNSNRRNVKVFSSQMFKDADGDPTSNISENDLQMAAEELAIRHFIGKNEIFRMFLNDPAFYSDLFKRISGAVSPKTMADVSSDLMEYVNDGNTFIENGKVTFLSIKEPIGYISDTAQQLYDSILTDPEVKGQWSDSLRTNEKGELIVDRKELEKADGILPVSLPTFRALKYSVGQWSDEMEEAYQREMKLLSQIRAGKIFRPEDVQDMEGAAFPVDKFQYFGPSKVSDQTMHVPGFLKMSVMPIFPSLAFINGVEYSNILRMLDAMDANEVGGFVIPSAHKVGAVNDRHTVPYFTASGDMEFQEPTEFSKIDFDLRFFGSQLEIKPYWKHKVVRATQHAVQVSADLYEDGKPVSLRAESLDKHHNGILGGMTRRAFRKMLKDLKIEKTNVDGVPAFRMSRGSYEAILEKLEKEVGEKEGGKSLMSAIKVLKTEKTPFKFDYFVDRYRMETMFYSSIGKEIIKKRMFGEGMVQAPELGYEVGYTTDRNGNKVKVDNAELKFYEGDEGGWVMEVFMPHHFKELVGSDVRIARNGDIMVDGRLMKDTAGLLEAVGIRIPTDGKHSIELIRVKGFLPQSAGVRMVVPGGLVLKAGSDFDIDKLITYLKTYRYNEGVLSPVRFKDSVEDWFTGQQNMFASQINEMFSQEIGVSTLNQAGTVIVDAKITDKDVLMDVLFNTFKNTDPFTKHNLTSFIEFELESLVELEGWLKKGETTRTDTEAEISKESFRGAADALLEKIPEFFNISEVDGVYTLDRKPYEQWQAENPGLTKYDVNSEAALQNAYMEVTKELLSMSDGNTLDEFLRPVNTAKYAELADEIMKKDKTLPNLENVSDFHLETRLPHLIRVTNAFLQGKRVVGIAALASTHHIKAQRAGLQLNTLHEYELPNGTFRTAKIRFKGFENRGDSISLARIKDINDDRKVSDNISQLVNASVDIVKKPIIHILNLGPDTAPAALVLMRAGVPLDSIVYFMNQPIVREYMRMNGINRSRLNRALDDSLMPEKLIDSVAAKFRSDLDPADIFFSEKQLSDMVGKTPDAMTQEQLAMQQQVLNDFLLYLELGSDMTSAITAQSFDTKLPKSRAHFALIQGQYDAVASKGVFPGLERITESEESFLSDMKDYNFVAQDLLKDLFVANSSLGEYQVARDLILKGLTDSRNRMSMDDKLRVLERFEQYVVSVILTRMEQEDGEKVASFADSFLYGPDSFANRLGKILTSSNHALKNNDFLNFLIPVVQEVRETEAGLEKDNDYVEPQFKAMNVYDEAALYDSFMEIIEYDSRKGTRIAKDVLYATLIQAGTMNTPFSFLDKIPNDFYLKMAKDVFGQLEKDPNSVRFLAESLLEGFYKNMVNDFTVVPYVKGKANRKRLFTQYTKVSDRTEKGRKLGEARQKTQYTLEQNTPLNEITVDIRKVDTTGYGSRSYLNTSDKVGVAISRAEDVAPEDINDNCKS